VVQKGREKVRRVRGAGGSYSLEKGFGGVLEGPGGPEVGAKV